MYGCPSGLLFSSLSSAPARFILEQSRPDLYSPVYQWPFFSQLQFLITRTQLVPILKQIFTQTYIKIVLLIANRPALTKLYTYSTRWQMLILSTTWSPSSKKSYSQRILSSQQKVIPCLTIMTLKFFLFFIIKFRGLCTNSCLVPFLMFR